MHDWFLINPFHGRCQYRSYSESGWGRRRLKRELLLRAELIFDIKKLTTKKRFRSENVTFESRFSVHIYTYVVVASLLVYYLNPLAKTISILLGCSSLRQAN